MTPHPGDLLSAYADGELSADERALVDEHLDSCATCRQELDATAEAKAWVTGLPEVLPPFGFYERMLLDPSKGRPRRRDWATRIGLAGLAATAAVWLGVVAMTGLDSRRPSGVPALNSLVGLHERAPRTTPSGQAAQQRATHLGLPSAVDDYELVAVIDHGSEEQAVYWEGDQPLSVFLFRRYHIDESALPAGSREIVVAGNPAWIVPWRGGPLLVSQIGPNAVVMVGGDLAASMVGDVRPRAPGRSLGDRLEGAGEGLLQAFGM